MLAAVIFSGGYYLFLHYTKPRKALALLVLVGIVAVAAFYGGETKSSRVDWEAAARSMGLATLALSALAFAVHFFRKTDK